MGWDNLAKQAVSLIIAVAEKQREDSTNSVSSLSAHCDVLIAYAMTLYLKLVIDRHTGNLKEFVLVLTRSPVDIG